MASPLPQGPPPGPPPGGPPPQPGGPPALATILPHEVLNQLLGALSPEERAAFPTLPVAAQDDLLLKAAERLGILPSPGGGPQPQPIGPGGPPPPGAGPIVGPTGPAPGPITPPPMPLMPPPGAMPVGGPPPPLPPGPGGPPHLAAGPPPPIDLNARRPPAPKPSGPTLPQEEPPPADWEFPSLDDLMADQTATGRPRDYRWHDAPDHAEICRLAQEALDDTFWQERNQACYDQSWCYYRSRLWAQLTGKPFSDIEGTLSYMLSGPTKQVDRVVERTRGDSAALVFDLKQRSERERYERSAANLENIVRDQWGKHLRAHFDRVSQHGPDAALDRKIAFLPTLHGTAGWSLRANVRRKKGAKKRDINADYPATLTLIPAHELYQLGDLTLRIQSVTLKEARRLAKDVRDRWPTPTKDDLREQPWYPSDEHRCRLIAGSDVVGRWYFQCFDLALTGDEVKRGNVPEEDARFWVVKPQRMDYGFCLFQLPPGWQSTGDNALPDDRQPAENYGRQFARGVLFANLFDFFVQDQAASIALSTFIYNHDPAMVEVVDAATRQNLGEPLPPEMKYVRGAKNTRIKDEGASPLLKHFADTASDNFMLSMSFGQTADTFPAALGGGGDAQSGYDRRQMVENAQLLHVEAIRKWVARTVEAISRRWIELMWRLGSGDKKVFGELPFVRARGGVGEGTLTVDDIEKAGIAISVEYHEDDLDRDLRLNNIVIPRVEKKLISLERGREQLGEPEPALEERRIDEEMALSHPAMQELRAIIALRDRPGFLPFLLDALERNASGQKIPQSGLPGLPSPPGGGGPAPTPQPGVPAGNLPPGASGMPPGMRMPPGTGA